MRFDKFFHLILLAVLIAVVAGLAGYGNTSASGLASTVASGPQHSSGAGGGLGLMASNVLTVCSDTTYPPMEYTPPSHPGTFVGADVDLANALAKKLGLTGAKIVKTPFDSIIPALQAKRCDIIMSSMSATPARAKVVSFIPYMKSVEGVLVRSSSSIHSNGYAGLCGKKVAVESATTELDGLTAQNQKCSNKISILHFTADTDAFEAFKAGHADAYTGDLPVVANYIRQSHGSYRLAGKPITLAEPYGIALRKSSTKLEAALKLALIRIEKNGMYLKILRKWGISAAAR